MRDCREGLILWASPRIRAIDFTTAMPTPLRPLCPPLCDRYAHPYDRYAHPLRPLCPPFTTAMPPLYDRYAHPLRPLCPPPESGLWYFEVGFLDMDLVFLVNTPGGKDLGFNQFVEG